MEKQSGSGLTVSVVVATYNGEKYLAEQLQSILDQDYAPLEVIISDDGSTDGTMEIARRFAECDARVRVFRNEGPHGASANFYSAMRRAKGDFIAISDQDDIWLPQKLGKQVRTMTAIGGVKSASVGVNQRRSRAMACSSSPTAGGLMLASYGSYLAMRFPVIPCS